MLRARRSPVAGVAVAAALVVACSSSQPPAPAAFVAAFFKPSYDANNNNLCHFGSQMTALSIGTAASDGPVVAYDGSSPGAGSTVNVVCSVAGGFSVGLQASLTSDTTNIAGSIAISGSVDSSGTASSSITATIQALGTGYSEPDCTLTAKYKGADIPSMPTIAPGRLWAHLSCPTMKATDGSSMLVAGKTVTSQCDLESDFIFENCSQ